MATAGMGDVLTGVIAGLRAQLADSALAARIGVLVHALAGDSAARGGQRGLIASDVIGGAARLGQSVSDQAQTGSRAAPRKPKPWRARLLGTRPHRARPAAVVELSGELGTGKSTFARGALRALGATGPIKSPSYTLLEIYELPRRSQVVHLDLYRLNDPEELETPGAGRLPRPGFLWLVEWPERAAGPTAARRPAIRVFHRGRRTSHPED